VLAYIATYTEERQSVSAFLIMRPTAGGRKLTVSAASSLQPLEVTVDSSSLKSVSPNAKPLTPLRTLSGQRSPSEGSRTSPLNDTLTRSPLSPIPSPSALVSLYPQSLSPTGASIGIQAGPALPEIQRNEDTVLAPVVSPVAVVAKPQQPTGAPQFRRGTTLVIDTNEEQPLLREQVADDHLLSNTADGTGSDEEDEPISPKSRPLSPANDDGPIVLASANDTGDFLDRSKVASHAASMRQLSDKIFFADMNVDKPKQLKTLTDPLHHAVSLTEEIDVRMILEELGQNSANAVARKESISGFTSLHVAALACATPNIVSALLNVYREQVTKQLLLDIAALQAKRDETLHGLSRPSAPSVSPADTKAPGGTAVDNAHRRSIRAGAASGPELATSASPSIRQSMTKRWFKEEVERLQRKAEFQIEVATHNFIGCFVFPLTAVAL
jgi:hypothetical protein